MSRLAKHVSTRETPQTEAIPGKKMSANNGGGFSFEVTPWTRLDRFLILSSENGTFYVGERKLTQENAACVLACAKLDANRTVSRIVEISEAGRAPKNEPAVFALALIASLGDPQAKSLALEAMRHVCRIPTALMQFAGSCQELRGWGRGLRRAVADWYLKSAEKDINQLAYHMVKYQQRDGISNRDLLRLSHAPLNNALFRWMVNADMGSREVRRSKAGTKELLRKDVYAAVSDGLPAIVQAFEQAKVATGAKEIIRLIADFNLPRECIPTQHLNDAGVWEALLAKMPMTAMVRNLGKMTAVGLLKPLSAASRKVCEALTNVEAIKKARLHPLAILTAQKVYAQGHGDKGSLTWTPDQSIIAALDSAFYLAFQAVEPAGKRFLMGVDVSGSMEGAKIAGSPLTAREAAAALALVTAHTEPWTASMGFSNKFIPLPFGKGMRLDAALAATRGLPFSNTDCALPMTWALANKIQVDTFVCLTDSETNSSSIHPCQALRKYRDQMGIPAKLVVAGLTATNFSIADASDAGMLDVVGMDSAVPSVISDFARG